MKVAVLDSLVLKLVMWKENCLSFFIDLNERSLGQVHFFFPLDFPQEVMMHVVYLGGDFFDLGI